MLELVDLTAGPGDRAILRDLNLELARGERTALLGASGVGKSTLLRAVCGLLRPQAGRIRIDQREVFGPGVDVSPARRGVSMVFQSFALWPHLRAREHLRLVQPDAGGPDWLQRLGLADKADRLPGQLSGGEQARLSLARALAARPSLLLLDEAFRNLDPALARELRAELLGWFEEIGQTVLLVSHEPDEAELLAQRWCVLGPDGVLAHDTPQRLRARPEHEEVAALFGRSDFLPATWAGEDRMHCALGEVEATGPDDADHLVLRPEQLCLSEDGPGPRARILGRFREQGREILRLDLDGALVHAAAPDQPLAEDHPILRVVAPLQAVRGRRAMESNR